MKAWIAKHPYGILPILFVPLAALGWLFSNPISTLVVQFDSGFAEVNFGLVILMAIMIFSLLTAGIARICKAEDPTIWAFATLILLLLAYDAIMNAALLTEGYTTISGVVQSFFFLFVIIALGSERWKKFIASQFSE
jgi:hypothetical protein